MPWRFWKKGGWLIKSRFRWIIRLYKDGKQVRQEEIVRLNRRPPLTITAYAEDTAYKTNKKVELVLSRGEQWTGPVAKDHEFFVDFTIETSDYDDEPTRFTFKKPEEAIEKFFALWNEYEIGEHFVELTGSGCPGALKEEPVVKCKYCDNEATKTLVWLKDKRRLPARIKLPWCGCDLMTALKRFWASPYQVVEGVDYEIEKLAQSV